MTEERYLFFQDGTYGPNGLTLPDGSIPTEAEMDEFAELEKARMSALTGLFAVAFVGKDIDDAAANGDISTMVKMGPDFMRATRIARTRSREFAELLEDN